MKSIRVLLVDDDEVEREILQRALRKGLDCDIETATSALAALEGIEHKEFDIILLDYHMPGLNGLEAIPKIRAFNHLKQAPIVIITNNENEDLALECIDAGAQDFIVKSDVTTDLLSRTVTKSKHRYDLELERFQNYNKVKTLAERDRLTGLYNRYFFEESLNHILQEQNRKEGTLVAVMLLDLNKFKQINDNYGHHIGDKLLISVANRMKRVLRGNELFCRLGGDEFGVVAAGLKTMRKAKGIATRILESLSDPIEIEEHKIVCSGSIGIALAPINGNSVEELVKYADIAMYRAKKLPNVKVCVYEDNMEAAFLYRYRIESELRAQIKTGYPDMCVEYMPIVDLQTDTMVGVEALIKWEREAESISSNDFLGVAEETGLIRTLGKWVIQTALEQLAPIVRARSKRFTIATNVSGQQLCDPTLFDFINKQLDAYKVAPTQFAIEVSETVLLEDDPISEHTLNSLSKLGVNLSIDRFGSELAPLTCLTKWHIKQVKIDRSVCQNFDGDDKQNIAIEGLIELLTKLNIEPLAVGIETVEQAKACLDMGITKSQGFLHFKPLSYQSLKPLLCEPLSHRALSVSR